MLIKAEKIYYTFLYVPLSLVLYLTCKAYQDKPHLSLLPSSSMAFPKGIFKVQMKK